MDGEEAYLGEELSEYEDNFHEMRTIGEGGMGKAILVKRKKDGALRIAKVSILKANVENCIHEWQITNRLRHKNIVGSERSFYG